MWKALGLRVKPFGLESVDDWIWESETLESLYMEVEVRLFGSIHREYHWLIFENCLLKGGILDLSKNNRCKVMSPNFENLLKWVFDFARVVSGIVVFSFMCFWNVWFDWVWDFRKVACCSASVNIRYSWSHFSVLGAPHGLCPFWIWYYKLCCEIRLKWTVNAWCLFVQRSNAAVIFEINDWFSEFYLVWIVLSLYEFYFKSPTVPSGPRLKVKSCVGCDMLYYF